MQHSIITWKTIHNFGDLWWRHLQMRKKLFVDEMHWQIPHTEEVETDQYDTPSTVYLISHIDGQPVAASRLNSCCATYGEWSYMIKDACAGKLPGIPENLMDNPPSDSSFWEATRFTVDPSIPRQERTAVLAENAKALAATARDLGIKNLIALMPPAYVRWLTSEGLPTRRAGPILKDAGDNRICAMVMPL